jgi:hypothetical protein
VNVAETREPSFELANATAALGACRMLVFAVEGAAACASEVDRSDIRSAHALAVEALGADEAARIRDEVQR